MARMPFSNENMRQPVKGKPHIAFIEGFWRVSPTPKPASYETRIAWKNAHGFVRMLNGCLWL